MIALKPRIFIQPFPAWGSRRLHAATKIIKETWRSIACFNDTYNEYWRRQLYSKTVFHLNNSFPSIVFVKHDIKTLSTRFQNRKLLEVGSEISLVFFCAIDETLTFACASEHRRAFSLYGETGIFVAIELSSQYNAETFFVPTIFIFILPFAVISRFFIDRN